MGSEGKVPYEEARDQLLARIAAGLSEAREQLLERINAELTERGLRSLPKLGDRTKGEIEIMGIAQIYDYNKRFFTDVHFDVLFPNGKPGAFTVRFNANGKTSDGAVIVTLVNGKFAIVKQWRLPLGRWTYEVARGLGEKLDQAAIQGGIGTMKIGDLPLGTLTRELTEEVMATAQVTSVTHLGNVAENSGTHNVAPSNFLVQLAVDPVKLETKLVGDEDNINVLLWDAERVKAELGKKLCDAHTLSALFLAFRHIETLPRV